MSTSRTKSSPLQLIEIAKPLSPLPPNYGWRPDGQGFDWAVVERNFSFTMMGRVVTGDERFYGTPLTEPALGYHPDPLAKQLHDLLWQLRGKLQTSGKSERRTGNQKTAIAALEKQIHEAKRAVWVATFEPLCAKAGKVEQASLLF